LARGGHLDDADVQHRAAGPLRLGDRVETDLEAWNVGVEVGEPEVVAPLGQFEAEHVGVEPDRAIEIAHAQLNQQFRAIPDITDAAGWLKSDHRAGRHEHHGEFHHACLR
jgi:hypothetical protein